MSFKQQKNLLQNLIPKSTLRALLLCGLAFAGAYTAFSAPKKTDKVDLNDVKEQKRPKGDKPERATLSVSRNEAFLIVTESKLLKEITKAIAYLSKTAAQMPKKSTARLEMREKLINLRLESSVYYANQEMRAYDKAYTNWQNGGSKGRPPRLNSRKSKEQWSVLAKDAETLLAEFPRSKNADNTMFNMGLAQSFLGREKDAARVFSQLIAKYPNSQKAGDAYFALGDFYFDRTDFRNAMNNYRNALRFKQSKAYSYSLFKLGWCNYNLGNSKNALAYWMQTVSAAGQSGKKGLALREEALRDMVYAFAELKQVEPAIDYYRRNGGQKFIGKFLMLLSQTFSDQGQYNAAIKTLKRYQEVAPYDDGAPDTQKEIIMLNYELNRWPSLWAELGRFPKMYGPQSAWASRNKNDRKRFLEVQQMIKDQILYYAKLTHKNAQKDDNRGAYAQAMVGYRLYLANYPKSKEVPEVKYNMADIEYFTKDYNNAGRLYLDIVFLGKDKAVIYDPKTGKGNNIHKKSAEYMLDAYLNNFEPELKVLVKQKPDFNKPARPISKRATSFMKACGYYQKFYPEDKKNIKSCDVFITEIFYRSQDRKMSMKYLWLLARKYPGSKEGNEAIENLIPLYKNDKVGLSKAATELLKIPAYSKGKIGNKLRDLERGTQVDIAKQEKNPCKRAKGFEDLYKKNPRAKDADALIFNAAGDYILCKQIPEAITAYMIVLKRHPTSEGAKDAMLEVAKLHERRLELAAAASFFQQYAQKYSKDKFAIGSLARACELQAALDSPRAVNTCLMFAQADATGAKLVFGRMMRSAFSARDEARLIQYVRIYLSKFKLSAEEAIVANNMIYTAANGRGGAAQQASGQIMNAFRSSHGNVSGEALRAVGGIVFRNVNVEMARFEKFKLRGGTVDNLVASIQQKVAALGRLKQAYDQVLQVKDPYWGVAALYQIGYAHELLALDLEQPPQITGAPYADVVKQLAPDAKGARQEARNLYASAVGSVSKFMAYNDWAGKALGGVARIGGKNVSFEDLIVTPDFLGAEVPTSIISAVRTGGD